MISMMAMVWPSQRFRTIIWTHTTTLHTPQPSTHHRETVACMWGVIGASPHLVPVPRVAPRQPAPGIRMRNSGTCMSAAPHTVLEASGNAAVRRPAQEAPDCNARPALWEMPALRMAPQGGIDGQGPRAGARGRCYMCSLRRLVFLVSCENR